MTLSSSVVNNSENTPIHAPPPLPSILRQGVCCLLQVSSNSNTILHSGDGGRKALFSPFEVGKMSERPFSEEKV